MSAREGGRKPDQLRQISFEPDFLENPHGSVVVTQGRTKVLCTAMVEDDIPRWLRNKGRGWITAEYSLLPASTGERVQREAARGKQQGRTVEIQRLIGRAVRAVADFEALGERTLWLDCDVLQADGGTRCAAICGAYVAAMRALDRFGLSRTFRDSVAAVSVGVVEGVPLLDLDYAEDSSADTDMNVVMTGDGRLVEVQATAERDPFARETLDELLELAAAGIGEIATLQADGGTRCAAICGAYVAARRALDRFGLSKALRGSVAAVSVGIVGAEALLDLDYLEDSSAEVDMNVVMTGDGRVIEVQATAEGEPFGRDALDLLLDLAAGGIEQCSEAQRAALEAVLA